MCCVPKAALCFLLNLCNDSTTSRQQMTLQWRICFVKFTSRKIDPIWWLINKQPSFRAPIPNYAWLSVEWRAFIHYPPHTTILSFRQYGSKTSSQRSCWSVSAFHTRSFPSNDVYVRKFDFPRCGSMRKYQQTGGEQSTAQLSICESVCHFVTLFLSAVIRGDRRKMFPSRRRRS